MKKYVLDSNTYITAARNEQFARELIRFSERFLPQLYLHAVVVQELYTGAINEQARRVVDRLLTTSCREEGATIVTLNDRDFIRIQQVERVAFTTPWPRR